MNLLLTFFLVTPANAKTPTDSTSPQISPVTKSRVQASFIRAPLSFEANQGQTDDSVKFLARGSGYTMFLTANEAVMVLKKATGEGQQAEATQRSKLKTQNYEQTVLRMKLVGANPDPEVAGLEALPGKVNYFIGNEPKKWRTNIPTYKRVEYQDVYPGVNLVYYGNQRQLEYDFVVSPGADPSKIQLAFEGADKIEVDTKGDLILRTALGDLRLHKPLVYQEIAGVRKPISAAYVLLPRPLGEGKGEGRQEVTFQIASYDSTRALTIDPVLSYSTYLGGTGLDRGFAIAADASGNAYVTGMTNSTNFPIANPFQATFQGASGPLDAFGDAFVTKLNPAGSVDYSTYLGGSDNDEGQGIAVDSSGNAYVTGLTNSSNFPVTAGAFQTAKSAGHDVFVTKLNSQGNGLVYSSYLGGSDSEGGFGIAVDCVGNAYMTGYTDSSDFPTVNPFQATLRGFRNTFVTRFNPAGNAIAYSTYLGGSTPSGSGDRGFDIAVDCAGNAYVTGQTNSTDRPVTLGAFQTTYGGGEADAFVTKLDTSQTGTASLVYSSYVGGSGSEGADGIVVDSSGYAYVTGRTESSNFPTTPGALQTAFGGGGADAFVTKLSLAGSALVYSTYLGGSGDDGGFGIAVDSLGNAYLAGNTKSSNFPLSNPIQGTFGGSGNVWGDAFVTKLNAAGDDLIYSTYLGGSDNDVAVDIALDSCGNAYVTGLTRSTKFPVANPLFASYRGGIDDGFVAKIEFPGTSFHDDFNRPDSPTVGNGWLDSPNNSGGNLSIRSGQLTPSAIGGSEGIYRLLTFTTPVSVSATLAESSGYGGLPRQYAAEFGIRSDGTRFSGYRLSFSRSDINYNDSLIQVIDGNAVIARFYPTIQFGPVLDLQFTFNNDGSVVGTVNQNGQSESFSFPAHTIQSNGPYFLIVLAGPDGRDTSNPIYHRLDDLTISGTCVPSTPPLLNVAPTSLSFGDVIVNTTSDMTFTVTNDGGETLTGNVAASAPFAIVSGGSFSLAAGQSQTVTVRFSPAAAATFVGSAEVTSNGGSAAVNLSGTGVPLPVSIDIKPGSFPNSINLGSGGTVPVAIVSTSSFDARTVDPTTVTLASAPVALRGKGTPMTSVEDINGDGLLDLVVHVSTEALQLSETDTQAVLEGKTSSGTPIRGTDTVRVVP